MAGCKKQRLGSWDPFPDLSAAACELRAATTISKLEPCAGEERQKDLEAFYERLQNLQNSCEVNSPWYKPILVSVEGILVQAFGQDSGDMCCQSTVRVACAPPASLSIVKGIFDQVGGAAAKAFDVVSNYMVVQECKDICAAECTPLVFIIYNFCSSVFSCSLGASGDGESMVWPPGLPKPRLQLVVVQDAEASSPKLAKVSRALQKLDVDQVSLRVNGLSESEMLDVVMGEIQKAMFPSTEDLESLLGADPLRCLVNVARKEGLLRDVSGDKKWQLGRRGKHVPWSFQLATPSCSPGGPPSVRNLGIHSVTETGFIFFSLGSAGGAAGQAGAEVPASMVLLLGSYPFQQQWRGEGVVRKMRWGSPAPPFSLACAMERCRELWKQGPSQGRMALSDQEAVSGTRADDTREGPSTAYIFIPHRMEVLIGHPPAPGGTRRCEWQRWASRRWEGPKAVLPFSPKPVVAREQPMKGRKVTVVLMGPHTAGKSTVRKCLAERLQWRSDEELGTSLRGEEEEKGRYHKAWDDTIHQAEVARDQERRSTVTSRVVETWHLGNLAWALTRHPEQQEDLLKRAVDAIGQEIETGIVLMVLLKIDAATMVRRRAIFQTSALRFQDEEADAEKLSKATGEKLEEPFNVGT
ncbi:unnamed protein product [Symbiodinium sp. CCMP2592]|nr:unnamed protein product [Symbiodinium sp. CCMP2592]